MVFAQERNLKSVFLDIDLFAVLAENSIF